MIILLLAAICLIGAIAFNVRYNRKVIAEQGKIDHRNKKYLVIKAITMMPSFILFIISSQAKPVIEIPVCFIMCCSWFWFLFDGFFALAGGHKFFFTGSEDGPEDAGTDNFLQSIPMWLHILIKIVLIVSSTYAYIILL